MNRTRGAGARWPLVGMAVCMALTVGCAEPVSSDTAGAPAERADSLTKARASGPPFLVRDLWEADASLYSQTRRFAAVGGQLYFSNA